MALVQPAFAERVDTQIVITPGRHGDHSLSEDAELWDETTGDGLGDDESTVARAAG